MLCSILLNTCFCSLMSKMGNHVSTEDQQWTRTFEEIKNAHDLAYCLIESAISLEEQEKPAEVNYFSISRCYFKSCIDWSVCY